MPSRIKFLMRCRDRVSASASFVLLAPRSGSKRFLLTITSVPTSGRGAVSGFASAASTGVVRFATVGRSHGPSFHRRYVRALTSPVAKSIRTVSNDERLRISKPSQRERLAEEPQFYVICTENQRQITGRAGRIKSIAAQLDGKATAPVEFIILGRGAKSENCCSLASTPLGNSSRSTLARGNRLSCSVKERKPKAKGSAELRP